LALVLYKAKSHALSNNARWIRDSQIPAHKDNCEFRVQQRELFNAGGPGRGSEARCFDIDDVMRYQFSALKPSRGSVDVVGFGCESTSQRCFVSAVPRLVKGCDYGPLGERALVYILSKYAGWARVADVSPHDLRHRFGYRMARTVPIHRLAQLMGHDSLDTTLRYVHGTQQDLQQAVETIAWA
jgi:integrase